VETGRRGGCRGRDGGGVFMRMRLRLLLPCFTMPLALCQSLRPLA
jgi:hypothetical protein